MSEKQMPFNGLSFDQAERLALLAEECGELVQAIGKVLRHGYESQSPFNDMNNSNRDDVAKEAGDVLAALSLLTDSFDVSRSLVDFAFRTKLEKVGKYLHHAKVDEAASENYTRASNSSAELVAALHVISMAHNLDAAQQHARAALKSSRGDL